MSEHTPTPWQRNGVRSKLGDESCITVGPDGSPLAYLPIGSQQGDKYHAVALNDAAFIVKAVNNHDRLVEMVWELMGTCVFNHQRMQARALLDELK